MHEKFENRKSTMKTIILISSIFYILGLKISNKFDFVKRSTPVEKIIVHKAQPAAPEKAIDYKEAEADKPVKDTVTGGCATDKILEKE